MSVADDKRVFLTGGAGFIGRFAIEALLRRGFSVHALVRPGRERRESRGALFWHEGDLFQTDAMALLLKSIAPNYMLHLAWHVGEGYLASGENERYREASEGLAQAFAACGGRRLVAAGTLFEYDPHYSLFCEGMTPESDRNQYVKNKRLLYKRPTEMAREDGLSLAWARIFSLSGPGEKRERMVPSIILSLLRGEPVRLKKPYFHHDYSYIEDMADALAALLESDVQGAVNIASGDVVRLEHLALLTGELMCCRPDLITAPVGYEYDEPRVMWGDTTRMRQEVGWSPSHTLREGLQKTIDYWRTVDGEGK